MVGRCTEALSRPAQVSVDVSSGGGPRVAQEAHWHTGTGGVLVLALSLPPASPPDSRTQQYSDPPPPSTSSTGTTRHQASSSSSPPYLWCDDGGPWDVGHSNTEQYICIQILDISRVSAG